MRVRYYDNFNDVIEVLDSAKRKANNRVGMLLKRELKNVIKSTFNKRTGKLLRNVKYEIEENSVIVGIRKRIFYSTFLHKGTKVRKHRSGKRVGKLKRTDYLIEVAEKVKDKVENLYISIIQGEFRRR